MGIHPLDLWDLVIQVFHSSSNQFPSPKRVYRETLLRDTSSSDGNKRTKSNNETPVENPPELPWIGCLTEYNLDSKIQIEFVDTKHQLADLLKRRPPCRREFKTGRWRRRLAVAKPRSVCLVSTSLTISRRIRSWIRRMSKEPREIAGVTLAKICSQHCSRSCGKNAAGHCPRPHAQNNAAKEENSFQVDLRVHGVSQDNIYKDEERMTEMQNLVDGLQDGHRD